MVTTQPSLSTAWNAVWAPPPKDCAKLNWDVAVDRVYCKVGIGIVVHESEGNIPATMRKRQDLLQILY